MVAMLLSLPKELSLVPTANPSIPAMPPLGPAHHSLGLLAWQLPQGGPNILVGTQQHTGQSCPPGLEMIPAHQRSDKSN